MKLGITAIFPPAAPGRPPTVIVGEEDRAVNVQFGALTIRLICPGDPGAVIVRAEAHDLHGNSLPVESRGATDVKNQVEYRVEVPAPQD